MYQLIQHLIAFKYACKINHWSTDIYSKHLLYDRLLADIDTWVDEIAETYFMANNNKTVFKSDILNPKFINRDLVKSCENIISLLEKLQKEEKSKRTLVLTPHPLEFARLCNLSVVEVEKNWEKILREYAHKLKCIIVKKNARTVICDGGKELTLNLTGNHGMATAGSGDVLCGIIAAFLAVFSDSSMAVKTAVYCHGLAGDLMVEKRGHHSLMAGDLLEAIPLLLSKGEKKREV